MGGRERERGRPPSGNGASSLHLAWEVGEAAEEVSVTLEILTRPAGDHLVFWALQVGFGGRGSQIAAAHLGLQWAREHPGCGAVNWGGYGPDGVLGGSSTKLACASGNPHSADLAWEEGRPYRLRVTRGEEGAAPAGHTPWNGSVSDGTSTWNVRDLWVPGGGELVNPMVWTECFTPCEGPGVLARWSDPEVVVRGRPSRPRGARVNYQSVADGGCSNTCSWAGDRGWYQATASPRHVPQGAHLPLGPTRPAAGPYPGPA